MESGHDKVWDAKCRACRYLNFGCGAHEVRPKSLDDCTGEEWNKASAAVGWGGGVPKLPEVLRPQSAPVQNELPAAWDLVMSDMRERDRFGKEKYGVRLQPKNGRDFLADAYQEALDLAVYLRGAIYERDGK